jgi:hypothetical protein
MSEEQPGSSHIHLLTANSTDTQVRFKEFTNNSKLVIYEVMVERLWFMIIDPFSMLGSASGVFLTTGRILIQCSALLV